MSLSAVVALLVSLLAAVGLSAAAAPAAAAADTPVIGVTKTLVNPGPFAPGEEFQYLIQYSCSSLTADCANAKLVDTIPGELDFVTNTTTGDPSTISYDAATKKLTVVFKSLLDGGAVGLKAGANGQLMVTTKFKAGTTDGTKAHNCVAATADGAAGDQACADAESKIKPSYGVSLDKSYTSTSGIQGSGAATTLDLAAKVGGNQAANTVTVVDPDPGQSTNNNPFDSFDLTGLKTLNLPAGVQANVQVKTTGDYTSVGTYTNGQTPNVPNPGDVTGIQVVYSCASPTAPACAGGKIAAGTTLDVKADVKLRDKLRSDSSKDVPAGTVHNQAAVTSTYPDAGPQSDTDTADYTVIGQTAGVQASKTISPGTGQEKSKTDVTMTVGGKNTGNVTANGMVVTDPDPTSSATPFDTFTFKSFNALALPSGVTAKVEVLVGGSWTQIGTGLASGATPSLGAVNAADVKGVRYTYTGSIPGGTEIKNSFVATLKDSVPAGTINPANCDAVSMTTGSGTGASQDGACASFKVTPIQTSVGADKSFSPTSGVAGTGAATKVTLTGSNGSNVPLTSFQLVEPGTGSDATFNSFDFTGFGALTAPAGTGWKVEVLVGGSWTQVGTGLTHGQTPALPGAISAGDVQGVRYTLVSGTIPANTTNALKTTIDLKLRDTKRSGGAVVAGTVHNCLTVTSAGVTDATDCADYTINAVNPGTGVGVGKNIVKDSVVQGSGDTTNVTLSGKNGANVPVTTIVLEDRNDIDAAGNGANKFWDSFDFNGFGSTAWPTGATGLKVEYYDGTGWQLVGNYAAAGTPSLPAGVDNSDVHGVRYTWTGSFAANTAVSATFNAKLKASAAAGTVKDCVQQTYSGGLVTTPVVKSACDTITISPQTHAVAQSKTFEPATGTLGLTPAATTTATLSVKNNSNVPLDSIVVTDPDGTTTPFAKFDLTGFGAVTLPGNVQVKIEANDGTWKDAGTYTNGQSVTVPGTITLANVTGVRLTFSGTAGNQIPANSSAMSVGLKLELRSTVRGGSAPVDETEIKNCFATTTSPDATLSGDPCASYTPMAQSPGVSAGKDWIPGSGVRDQLPASTITIKGRNSGNVPVEKLILQDPATTTPAVPAGSAFDAFDVTGFTGLVFPQGADQVQIDVLTADGNWHNGSAAATLPTGGTVNGVALGDIVGVRATFGNSDPNKRLAVVTDPTKTGNVGFNVKLRATLRSDGKPIDVPPTSSKDVPNTSSAQVVYNGVPGTPATANAKYTITAGTVKVTPDKTLYPEGSPETVNPNQTLVYQLAITNAGTRNLVAPVVLDKFDPSLLTYDAAQLFPSGGYQFDKNGSTLTGAGLQVDATTAGKLKFTFAAGDYLAPGQTAYLRVALTTKPGLPAGTVIDNTYGITWDVTSNGAISCTSGASGNFDGDANWCTDKQTVKVQKANSMASLKQIKGDDIPFTNVAAPGGPCPEADGYTYYPCIAHTHTDGIFDYKLNVTVSGNVPIKQARAIDELPRIGDKGVLLTDQDRLSQWTPTMQSAVDVTGLPEGATYTLYYATTYSPCITPLSNSGGAWCADWSSATPSDWSTVKSIGIDVLTVDGKPLAPGSTFTLHWKMKAPHEAPEQVGAITWNSFAFNGLPTDGTPWLPPAEPRKVGIDLSNPSITVTKTTKGGDGTFDFKLSGPGGSTVPVNTKDGYGEHTWGPTGLVAGQTYTLEEVAQPGWISTYTSCVGVDPTAHTATSVTFKAPASGEVSCAFTNTKRPTVTVAKTSVGGDGKFEFTLTGDGGSTKDVTTTGGTGSATWGPDGLVPGATYTLKETGDAGWISTFNSCTGTQDAKQNQDGSVTFTAAEGASVNCSFTNTGRPSVTVAKNSVGGDGKFEFTLTGDGGSTKDVTTKDGKGSDTWTGLTPGASYTLKETVDAGWISTFESCTGTQDAKQNEDGSVTFTAAAGADVKCSFTNTKRPEVTVAKTSVGGDGTFQFKLEGPGGSTKGVTTASGTGSASWGPEGLQPGTYTLSEDTSGDIGKNWVSTFNSCTGTQDAKQNEDGSVSFTVAAGADVKCSFTNTKRPTVTVAKSSVGGDGTFGFTLTGDGGTPVEVTTVDGSGDYTWGPAGLTPGGSYTLKETVDPGWVSKYESCTGTQDAKANEDGSVTFTAAAGASVTCSFSNTKRPTVTVAKSTEGGDGTFEFMLTGDGGSAVPVTTENGSGTHTWGPDGLTPGGSYTLTETGDSKWISTYVQCVDTSSTSAGELVTTALASPEVGVSFTAPAGASIVCSFSNTKRPVLILQKTTVGAADGTFPFVLTGTGGSTQDVTVAEGTGTATWGPEGLEPGDYTLSEDTSSLSDEWVSQYESCLNTGTDKAVGTATQDGAGVSLTLAAGDSVVCSFTNTKRPTITVAKKSVGGDGTFEFTLTGDGGSVVPVETKNGSGSYSWGPAGLTPGAQYTLSEKTDSGWVSSFDSCTGTQDAKQNEDGSVTFTAVAGSEVACAFTNTKRPTVTVTKKSVGGDGTFEFTLTGDGGSMVEVATKNGVGSHLWGPDGLVPGAQYTLTEKQRDGWTGEFTGCTGVEAVSAKGLSVTFTAAAGATIECTFTNTKVVPPPTTPPAPPTTPAPPPAPLPNTGVDALGMGTIALLLLAAGAALLVVAGLRTRRARRH